MESLVALIEQSEAFHFYHHRTLLIFISNYNIWLYKVQKIAALQKPY